MLLGHLHRHAKTLSRSDVERASSQLEQALREQARTERMVRSRRILAR
jgi:hypothetical protein